MSVEVIGMFGLMSGGVEDALAQIDVPQDGILTGIDWDASASLNASENAEAELSFIATNQLATNDVRGRISSISVRASQVTAVGIVTTWVQKFIGPFELTLAGGERIYIHASSTAGVACVVRCNLHFEMGTVIRRSARRR